MHLASTVLWTCTELGYPKWLAAMGQAFLGRHVVNITKTSNSHCHKDLQEEILASTTGPASGVAPASATIGIAYCEKIPGLASRVAAPTN
eukprot:12926331-Prorocentrum_lima.AAC.1